MLNWVAILRRILGLYRVASQRELGMMLGVPLGLEDGLGGEAIPWPILERVVADHGVSWDWLLTGAGDAPAAAPAPSGTTRKKAKSGRKAPPPPRIQTRELRRALLDGETPDGIADRVAEENNEARLEAELLGDDKPVGAAKEGGDDGDAALLARLSELRDGMREEVDRIERILKERG